MTKTRALFVVIVLAALSLVPTPASAVPVSGEFPDGFTVPAGETWDVEGAVTAGGSVVVLGTLRMGPGDSLTITGPPPSEYQGGGTMFDPGDAIVANDVGLWVLGGGVLDVQGTPVPPWSDPLAPDLDRDVRIQVPHILIQSTRPSRVNHALIVDSGVPGVLGRYPLHWHHSAHSGTSEAVGTVVLRGRNHAFWPHESNFVLLRDTIAVGTLGGIFGAAYGWDRGDSQHGSLWEHVLAIDTVAASGQSCRAGVKCQNGDFLLGRGTDLVLRDAVSVRSGLGGGIFWPSQANRNNANSLPNYWLVDGFSCIDCRFNGIASWQNNGHSFSETRNFVVRRAAAGIHHGAYLNSYQFSDGLIEDVKEGITSIAASSGEIGTPIRFERIVIRRAEVGVHFSDHIAQTGIPVEFTDLRFEGVALKVLDDSTGAGTTADFCRSGVRPEDVRVTNPASVIRTQVGDRAWRITAAGATPIAPFCGGGPAPSPSPTPPPEPSPSPTPPPEPSPSPTVDPPSLAERVSVLERRVDRLTDLVDRLSEEVRRLRRLVLSLTQSRG